MASFRRLLLVLLLASSAEAATVSDLYEAAQPVGDGSREAALSEALKSVAVRVSGRRDAGSRLGAALDQPRRYVQRFGITVEGVLEVGFDSASIDRLLAEAGLPIWGRERPLTLVMLSVPGAGGMPGWLEDQPSLEREAIERVARERGLPIKWPVMDAEDRARAEAERGSLLPLAERYGANAVLLGRAQSGSVRWTLVSQDGAAEISGDLVDGVHLAADTFARVYAVSGSSLASVTVEVSGIDDLDAYADAINYLESMTLVRTVTLEQVAGESMRLKLAVRGDAATLRRAIALDDRLVPLDATAGSPALAGDRLAFRYRR